MRDGLQSIAEIMPTETKIAWLDAEYAAGVREVEVSSFVPPKLLPQLADAEAVVRHAMTLPGLTVSALIPNSRGAERGLALGVPEMNFVLSVSEGHNLSNVRRSTEELIEDFRRVVALCHTAPRASGRGSIAGSPPRSAARSRAMSTRTGCGRIANEVAEAGADGIILADTVGYGQPAAIERVFRRVIADVAPLPVAAHFHDTRGLGLANVLAAYNAGAARSTPRSAGSAAAPTRRARPATSSWRTPCSSSNRWAATPGSISTAGRGARARRHGAARCRPYGAIAKAGLPRNFHAASVAQAAE